MINLPERSYLVKNNPDCYYTGCLVSGNQVLMGIQSPELVLIEFEASGVYVKTSVQGIAEEANEKDCLRQLREWQEALGFEAAPISVKPFFLLERWIGIKSLPTHYREFVDNPEKYAGERRKELQGDVDRWREQGDFVLYWDEEFYLNRDGEVDSS